MAHGSRLTAHGLLLSAITTLHVALNGYSFGGVTDRLPGTSPSSDHANVLPWIHAYRDAMLYSRDFQIQMGAGYRSIVWRGVAALPASIPLEWTFFLLHIATLLAVYSLLHALAFRLTRHRGLAWTACLLFLAQRFSPGGEPTFDAAFYLRSLALPLNLAAILLLLKGRAWSAVLLLSAGVAVHGASAVHAMAVAAALLLFDARLSRAHRGLCLVMMPALTWMIARLVGSDAVGAFEPASGDWLAIQRLTNGDHLFPPAWDNPAWRPLLPLLLPILHVAIDRRASPASRRIARAVLIVAVFMPLLAWFTARTLPLKFLFQMMPLRAMKLVMVLALPLCAAWIGGRSRDIRTAVGWRRAVGTIGVLLAAVGWAGRWGEVAALGCFGAMLIRRSGWRTKTIEGLALTAFAWLLYTAERSRPGPLTLAALGLTLLASVDFTAGRMPRQAVRIACLAVMLVAACLTPTQRDNLWVYAAWDFPWRPRESPWIDVQRWCAANTPIDALIVVPPWLEGFRTYGRRSLFADWKTGGMALLNEPFGVEWWRRITRLAPRQLNGGIYDILANNYDALSAEDFASLARDEGVTHIVVKRTIELPFPRVYENESFFVLRVMN